MDGGRGVVVVVVVVAWGALRQPPRDGERTFSRRSPLSPGVTPRREMRNKHSLVSQNRPSIL